MPVLWCNAPRSSVPVMSRTGTDPRKTLGEIGERLALEHLGRLGYALVARNHRTRWGELDLVVFDGSTLVFVEVKCRRASARAGAPLESVPPSKQRQVRRMAAAWLTEVEDRPRSADLRFDVVGVTVDAQGGLLRLDHLEGAF
jgi:putative endonuclease